MSAVTIATSMHQYLNVIGVPLEHQIDGPVKVKID